VNAPDTLPTPPAARKRKRRSPYKERKPIEWQNGLPVIDPGGEEDRIFHCIAKHREAVAHFDRCVTIENDAEGNVSADEFFYLQHNTKNAFDTMMLWARAVICDCPTTRRGLIHQARYLASQFNDSEGCAGGCTYLPDTMGEKPWPLTFLRSLAKGLRKMADEFPEQHGGRPQQ
jgi:hypothetical protein